MWLGFVGLHNTLEQIRASRETGKGWQHQDHQCSLTAFGWLTFASLVVMMASLPFVTLKCLHSTVSWQLRGSPLEFTSCHRQHEL